MGIFIIFLLNINYISAGKFLIQIEFLESQKSENPELYSKEYLDSLDSNDLENLFSKIQGISNKDARDLSRIKVII